MKTFSEWNENAAVDSRIDLPQTINEMIEFIASLRNEINNIYEKANAFEINFRTSGVAGAFPEYRDDCQEAETNFTQAMTGCNQVSKSLDGSMAILSRIAQQKVSGNKEETLGDVIMTSRMQ